MDNYMLMYCLTIWALQRSHRAIFALVGQPTGATGPFEIEAAENCS